MRAFALFALLFAPLVANAAADPLPRPDHVVIVVMENKAYSQIIGDSDAPYINALVRDGMLFTAS
ncbi:MAG TPA: acid phosphatase, partial [Gallionella sp.]|nr:acid phosphatase [Gallionella sp.]